jgi:hypothetical protein
LAQPNTSAPESQEITPPSSQPKPSEPDNQQPSPSPSGSPPESLDIPTSSNSSRTSNSVNSTGSKRILWAILLARIYEVFPLLCPLCGGTIQIISFVTETPTIHRILEHIGEPVEPPRISPARGPPIWDEEINQDSYGDPLAQPAPDDDFDQTVSW